MAWGSLVFFKRCPALRHKAVLSQELLYQLQPCHTSTVKRRTRQSIHARQRDAIRLSFEQAEDTVAPPGFWQVQQAFQPQDVRRREFVLFQQSSDEKTKLLVVRHG